MPKYLFVFSGLLQRVFCCCFPSSKSDDKTEKKTDDIVEEGELNASMVTNQNMQYISGRNTYPSRFQTPMEFEDIYRTQNYPVDGLELIPTDEKTTSKCKFCKRCKSCQADFDKDKAKDKNKKDIESKCSALNYLALLCILTCMFVSNMIVWLLMSR